MSETVFTGYATVTPGKCFECGLTDEWTVDGRGNILCSCQACVECGLVDAYGFHNPGCPVVAAAELAAYCETYCNASCGEHDSDCPSLAPATA